MATSHPFRIPVADLLKRPGAQSTARVSAPLSGLHAPGAEVPDDAPITVDVSLERVPDGIVVRGSVSTQWHAACSRCLAPVGGDLSLHVDELFEPHPLAGETYQLDDDVV